MLAKTERKKEIIISKKNTPFLLPEWVRQLDNYNIFVLNIQL